MATRRSGDEPRRETPAQPADAPSRKPRARGAASSMPMASAPSSSTSSASTPRRARTKRPSPPAEAALPGCAPVAGEAAKAESFWRAGLRALDNVRHDVQRRQATVIETLLGIPPVSAAATAEARLTLPGLPGLDPFGMRKFEDVFDQRVAAALERLGMPTREELEALHHKLDQVLAQIERIGATDAPPAQPPASPARAAARTRKPR